MTDTKTHAIIWYVAVPQERAANTRLEDARMEKQREERGLTGSLVLAWLLGFMSGMLALAWVSEAVRGHVCQ